jgi:ATP/maltotriose-dependent transcriptional regulator MalT
MQALTPSFQKQSSNYYRHDLVPRLQHSLQTRRLTLCVAPAGYGKTTVIQQLCEELGNHNETPLLIDAGALEASPKALEDAICDALKTIGIPLSGNQLSETLQGLQTPVAMIIDNCHLADSTLNRELLSALVNATHDNFHLCLGTRAEPDFVHRKLFLEGDASIYRSEDLQFRRQDIVNLITTSSTLTNSDAEKQIHKLADSIFERTLGWPVAVQLALFLLDGSKNAQRLEPLSGQEPFLTSYFDEQVMAFLNPALQSLAGTIALFEEASSALLTEITEDLRTREWVRELVRQNAFIIHRSRNRERFRFHPLFREYLLNSQWCPDSAKATSLLRRAAEWAERNANNVEAIEYAIAARDFRLAMQLISQSAQLIVRDQGLPPKLIKWFHEIPAKNNPTAIYVNYWLAWSLTFAHHYEKAEAKIAEVEKQLVNNRSLKPEERRLLKGQLWGLKIVLLVYRDEGEASFRQSEMWLKQFADIADPYDVALAFSARFVSASLQLNATEARRSIVNAKSRLATLDSVYYGIMWVELLDALCEMSFGNYLVAEKVLNNSRDNYLARNEETSPIASTMALLLARTRYESGDMEAAQSYLKEGKTHIHDHGITETAAAGLYVDFRLAAQIDKSEALYTLKNAEFISARHSDRLAFMIHRLRAELLIAHNELEAAEEESRLAGVTITSENRIAVANINSALLETDKLLLGIELLYAQSRYKAALFEVRQLLAKPQTTQRPLFHTQCLIIYSALLTHNQEHQLSGRQFSAALKIAVANGFFQTFIDLKTYTVPAIKALLKKRQNSGILPEDNLLERLCLALKLSGEKDDADTFEELSFSERERELLELLKSPLSIQGIADYVFLSKATVKWHLNNIYKKLAVNNRTGAITAAQRKGVLR